MVTKWGEEIIGALVVRVSRRERKAFVRAWTVLRRYRGKGVGRGLLEEGVGRVMGKAGVKGVEFEEEHASMFAFFFSPLIIAISSFFGAGFWDDCISLATCIVALHRSIFAIYEGSNGKSIYILAGSHVSTNLPVHVR